LEPRGRDRAGQGLARGAPGPQGVLAPHLAPRPPARRGPRRPPEGSRRLPPRARRPPQIARPLALPIPGHTAAGGAGGISVRPKLGRPQLLAFPIRSCPARGGAGGVRRGPVSSARLPKRQSLVSWPLTRGRRG